MPPSGGMDFVIGLDLGTAGSRAVAVGADGQIVAVASAAHPSLLTGDGQVEQDPADWWESAAGCLREVTRQAGRAPLAVALSGGLDAAVLDAEAAGVAPGSDGIIALDTWQGSRTPFPGPAAPRRLHRAGPRPRRAHLYRAILEAVAYGGRQVTEAFAGAGVTAPELVLTGGGGRSELWRQIHADVIGRPLLRLDQAQPAALGAAICAAGLGAFPGLRSGAAAMSRVAPGAQPDPANQQAYDTAFRAYQDVARALAR